jgi:DinB superfamily
VRNLLVRRHNSRFVTASQSQIVESVFGFQTAAFFTADGHSQLTFASFKTYFGVMTTPYASFLAGQDPIPVLSATASRLSELSQSIGVTRIEQPIAPGKWSPRQILIHLADCELAFGFRYRQTLALDNHTVQPFDQDLWAERYAAYDAQQSLETFTALRKWNLALIRTLTPEQFAKPVTHPERGQETLRILVEITAGHDINHLRQLEAMAGKSAA